jgi:hypothetical protein
VPSARGVGRSSVVRRLQGMAPAVARNGNKKTTTEHTETQRAQRKAMTTHLDFPDRAKQSIMTCSLCLSVCSVVAFVPTDLSNTSVQVF